MKFEITNNPYELNLDDLMVIGKRVNNSKRNFLFISKLLGKHLEVKPDIVKCTGQLLLSLKYPIRTENLIKYITDQSIEIKSELQKQIPISKKTLVIGFAETATGLGMSVAASMKNATYVTTTREDISNMKEVFTFEEEHSHATTHKMYFNQFDNFDQIILVDDEITTGRSMLNLIQQLVNITDIKDYTVLSILDWRNKNNQTEFKRIQNKLKINIETYSLISGIICDETTETIFQDTDTELMECISGINKEEMLERKNDYWKNSGKFGTTSENIQMLEKKCEEIAKKIEKEFHIHKNDKILILGHGENIYIPSRIASYIKGDVYFKTTTRSPIYCDGKVIKDRYYFYDKDVKYYFYNKEEIEKKYKKVIMIEEKECNIKLCKNYNIILI